MSPVAVRMNFPDSRDQRAERPADRLPELAAQLSEFFKEPTREFANDVASGRLLAYYREVFAALGLEPACLAGLAPDAGGNDAGELLREEYRRLFLGPRPPYVVPAESVYKPWAEDPECRLSIAREKGYLMGDSALDMIRRYQGHDLVIPDQYVSMPDHLALELEYLAYLLTHDRTEAAAAFLASHLDWLADLAKEIENLAPAGGFYRAAIATTCTVVAHLPAALRPREAAVIE